MQSLGISVPYESPWCDQSDFECSDRVKTLIDGVVWHKLGKKAARMDRAAKQEALKHCYIDISQNHGRKPFANALGITGTMTTSSRYYSFMRDGLILPFEMLLWHGHSRALVAPSEVKANQLKSLAGEGMSLPCLGTILWCALLVRFDR